MMFKFTADIGKRRGQISGMAEKDLRVCGRTTFSSIFKKKEIEPACTML